MESNDYAKRILDIKNEIVEEIRKLVPEDSAHRFSDKFYVHYIEGEVATTEVCSAVEVWCGGMVVFIVNHLKEFAKEEVIEGDAIYRYEPESFLDILDHLKKDLREKKLSIIRDILKEKDGNIEIEGEFEFLCADEGNINNISHSLLKGISLNGEKILVKTIWKEDHQQYDYDDDCITDEELDHVISCLKSQCKKKFSIYVHGCFGRVFDDIEADSYEDALAIAKKMWEEKPLNKEDSDGENWEPWKS